MPNTFYLFGGSSRVNIPFELQTEAALLLYLGLSQSELKKIWWFRHQMYTSFEVSKKAGKTREISAPDFRLKSLQQRIAQTLDKIYRPRDCVHGFVMDRSVRTNALAHSRGRYLINLDLKSFFPSITEGRVTGLFKSIGIDYRVAEILARICCNAGFLPQGAPTSPVISNMICFKMDKDLIRFARSQKSIYTRYADDITFSGFQPLIGFFSETIPNAGNFPTDLLSAPLRTIISESGFVVHPEKCHYADRHSRRMVTGIKINEGLNIDRRYLRDIRACLYNIEKQGLADAQTKLSTRFNKTCDISTYLHGRISWVGFVKGTSDPSYRGLANRFNVSFPHAPIKVMPTPDEIRERAIWVISTDVGEGTAFFLKGYGLVTADHCIDKATTIQIFHPSKTSNKFSVAVKHRCKHRDLAVLEHSLPSNDFFEMDAALGMPVIGNEVVALGFPNYGPGDKLNVRPGHISSFTVKSTIQLIETTQKLSQGMSGGPLVNREGDVVGIIHKGGPKEPRDFAINIAYFKQWFSSLP